MGSLVVSSPAGGLLLHTSMLSPVKWGEDGCDVTFSVHGCFEITEFHCPVCTSGLTAAHTSGLMCLIAGAYWVLIIIPLWGSCALGSHSLLGFWFSQELGRAYFSKLDFVPCGIPSSWISMCGNAEVAAAFFGISFSHAPSSSDLAVHCSHCPSSCSPTMVSAPSPCQGRCWNLTAASAFCSVEPPSFQVSLDADTILQFVVELLVCGPASGAGSLRAVPVISGPVVVLWLWGCRIPSASESRFYCIPKIF